MWCDRGNLIVENPAKESCCFCTQIFVYEYFDAKIATFWITSALWTQLGKSNFHCCWSCGREYMYICIGVYMNTHSKTVKCRKRDSLKPFFWKNRSKTTFLKLFSCYEKRLHSPFLPLHRQNKEVWVSGLNQHTANVPDRKVPKVRILLLPHFGSLAQLDQSTTLRTSVSGVRVSHESQYWRFGRVGLLHRS